MPDIIHLLPDSVANQIAAGEVIQRPASVVKELTENAIDAGAGEIKVIIKDAGRTLIQVVDNGSGMTETDARLAFERHATSKITSANDLFEIKTMGFRGEALASIAAIAHVELNTRHSEEELGTRIIIAASAVESQEPVNCPKGSNFIIKNLFYNVPARRRFLKSNTTELRHIINEVQRIAIANPHIAVSLSHNDQPLINLQPANHKLRITNIMGKSCSSNLLPVNIDSTVANISGFVGKPQNARRTTGEQFFFVNDRYMRHPYLHKAVMEAYSNLIPSETYPSYFLFFNIDPKMIDVNIHPTKTEIKFEDERMIWKILNAAIRESLGKHNIIPSIDFDTDGQIHIPTTVKDDVKAPEIILNPDFNPFETDNTVSGKPKYIPSNWEELYEGFKNDKHGLDFETDTIVIPSKENDKDFRFNEDSLYEKDQLQIEHTSYFQLKNKYILTPIRSGLMIIDQRRAHQRILYERFLDIIKTKKSTTQQLLFTETLKFNEEETALIREIKEDLVIFGFDIQEQDNGEFLLRGIPSEFENFNASKIMELLLNAYKTGEVDPEREIKEQFATIMAQNACMKSGEALSEKEMMTITNRLFRCKHPHFSPIGKPVISILENDELEKRFQ